MNPSNTGSFWTKAEALLGALVAAGVVQVNDSRQILAILGDVQALTASGGTAPDALVGEVTQLMTDLGVSGVALHAADSFEAFVHDVQAGQVGVIRGNATLFGVRGAYAFVPAASDQGRSLGLA